MSTHPVIPVARPPGRDLAAIERLAARARLLSWVSLVLISAEGVIGIGTGIAASSIALIGFGLDSVIEGMASIIIIWRFTGARTFSPAAEGRAQRLVAIQFFILAPYLVAESVRALVTGERPGVSALGIALAVASLLVMPVLGIAKQRIARRLGSPALRGEGRQNMLCTYLAAALLIGLLGNALLGAWWLDAVVGLYIAGMAVTEGRDAWRGEGCGCVAVPLAPPPCPAGPDCAEGPGCAPG